MSHTDEELDRLEAMLNGIPVEWEGMSLAELDGYVAGLIVCPEMRFCLLNGCRAYGATRARSRMSRRRRKSSGR